MSVCGSITAIKTDISTGCIRKEQWKNLQWIWTKFWMILSTMKVGLSVTNVLIMQKTCCVVLIISLYYNIET